MPTEHSPRYTARAAALTSAGIDLTAALGHGQLKEAIRIVEATGGSLSKSSDAAVQGTCDTLVLAPIASQTHTITVVATPTGHAKATGIVSIAVADAGGDTLAVTNTAGVIAIALANATDSKNTLTLIKAALDAVSAGQYSTFITGTASTQIVHGGTNDVTVRAAGAAATGALKSSTAGVAQAAAFVAIPASNSY